MKTVIVVPGLGDEGYLMRFHSLLSRWLDEGDNMVIFKTQWGGKETYKQKKDRLVDLYDQKTRGSDQVFVVGYSAGGPISVALFNERKNINRVILIAPKLKGLDTIGPKYQKIAPALVDTVEQSEKILAELRPEELEKFSILRPLRDKTVPDKDMFVPGMRTKKIVAINHSSAIAYSLLYKVKPILKSESHV